MRGMRVTVDKNAEAIDIPSMRELSDGSYLHHIDGEIFYVDHHDILRAIHGDYPIATTEAQVRVLITYLETVADRMKAAAA